MYGSGLSESDWYLLKDAVLGAGCGNFDYFDALPAKLKKHPIAVLVAEAKTGKSRAVRQAERLLVPHDPDQATLILMKS